MGAGKSTIASLLADKIRCRHIDLDNYIETSENLSVKEIFSTHGETAFRKKEEHYLEQIILDNRENLVVLSLGGGTLTSDVCKKLVKDNTFCIYLRSRPETIINRLKEGKSDRPLIRDVKEEDLLGRVSQLIESRRDGYEKSSSITVDTDGLSAEDIVGTISGYLTI